MAWRALLTTIANLDHRGQIRRL